MSIRFKDDRISGEWANCHPPLRAQILELAQYAEELGVKSLVITCLWRSAEENADLPNSNPKSLHMTLPIRAADIRTRNLTTDVVNQLDQHWHQHRPDDSYGLLVEANHIHVQQRG